MMWMRSEPEEIRSPDKKDKDKIRRGKKGKRERGKEVAVKARHGQKNTRAPKYAGTGNNLTLKGECNFARDLRSIH